MSENRPTPLMMPRRHLVALPDLPVAVVDTDAPAKIVVPGGRRTRVVTTIDDGVRKAKQLQPGQRVQPYVHGEARGSIRVVESVERIEDNTLVRVTFSTPHPTTDYKPAYRFVHLDAIGQEITVRQPTFVEVTR